MDLIEIAIEKVALNPHQMRTQFSEDEILELAQSIKSVGLLQPPLVRKKGDFYELISGERRLRALKSLGKKTFFALIADMSQQDSAVSCLIENVQRVDLNPLDVASAYSRLMSHFSLTQDALSERIGKKRSSVANYLRLFSLPKVIQDALKNQEISFGHAKVILSLKSLEQQMRLFEKIKAKNLSVRDSENLLKEKEVQKSTNGLKEDLEVFFLEYQEKLMKKFGTKVEVKRNSIAIHWDDLDSLERILTAVGVFDED